MIEVPTSFAPYAAFAEGICRDPAFSNPYFDTPEKIAAELNAAADNPRLHALAVRNGDVAGLFIFLVVEDERYLEMTLGLSRETAAYEEIADWLKARFPGFQADFSFNPRNAAIRDVLTRRGAEFYPAQKRMTLTGTPVPVDTTGIEPLSAAREDAYIAIHDTDCYWTGERVAKAPEQFDVFLAVEDGTVVGYIDVTKGGEVGEPFGLLVREDRRGKGWGRKLLFRAIEENRQKGMALDVDVDNFPAIALYRSMGFTDDPTPLNEAATWMIE